METTAVTHKLIKAEADRIRQMTEMFKLKENQFVKENKSDGCMSAENMKKKPLASHHYNNHPFIHIKRLKIQ